MYSVTCETGFTKFCFGFVKYDFLFIYLFFISILFQYPSLESVHDIKAHTTDVDDLDVHPNSRQVHAKCTVSHSEPENAFESI